MSKNRYESRFGHLPDTAIQAHLNILLQQGFTFFFVHLVAASLLCALLWLDHSKDVIIFSGWLAGIAVLAGLRWLNGGRFQANDLNDHKVLDRFAARYLLLTTCLNTLWGISCFLSPAHYLSVSGVHLVLLLIALSMALPVIVISRFMYCLQILLVLAPTVILAFQTGFFSEKLALVMIGMASAMLLAMATFHKVLSELNKAQINLLEQEQIDPATRVFNRRHFEQTYRVEWRRATHSHETLSLIMIEMDNYQRFYELKGQRETDDCLRMIADCIQSTASRVSDLATRYNDHSFALLLPNTSINDSFLLAERIRKAVEALSLEFKDGHYSRRITVSIGLSGCEPRSSFDQANDPTIKVIAPVMLVDTTERALQNAKRNGHNEVAYEYCGNQHAPGIQKELSGAEITDQLITA